MNAEDVADVQQSGLFGNQWNIFETSGHPNEMCFKPQLPTFVLTWTGVYCFLCQQTGYYALDCIF